MRLLLVFIAGIALGLGGGFYASQQKSALLALMDQPIAGSPSNDRLVGTSRDDVLVGKGGNDILEGGAGNDLLYGGTEDDRLEGGLGDDKLIGEDGSDSLIGGEGADWFVFKGLGALSGIDRIEDLQLNDIVVLEKLGITKYGAKGSGSVVAEDTTNGDIVFKCITAQGKSFQVIVANPSRALSATQFSAQHFLFSD